MSETLPPRAAIASWIWWAGFVALVAGGAAVSVVAYGGGMPGGLSENPIDKAVHFTAAGLLAFFLDGALRRRTLFTLHGFSIPLAAALVTVPCAVDEYAQRYSAHRSSSLWDFVADVAGVVVFTALSRRIAE
jgi:hypothetical protein